MNEIISDENNSIAHVLWIRLSWIATSQPLAIGCVVYDLSVNE
jgi:hypothetical protein